MKLWRFIVPSDRDYTLPSNPAYAYRGCLALVLAETEADARAQLEASGDDVRWLEVARVNAVPLHAPTVVAFVMF